MEIKIPDLGDAESVEVIELSVAVGDRVGPDDAVIVIESDKASMEVPAGASGTVRRLAVAVGDTVATGDVIATLTADEVDEPDTHAEGQAEGESDTRDQMSELTSPNQVANEQGTDVTNIIKGETIQLQDQEIEVLVPDVGDAEGVEVVEVSVAVGDQVAVGDLLVILESDKASMEVPCDNDGEVVRVHTKVGDQVGKDTLLVTLRAQTVVATEAKGGEPDTRADNKPSDAKSAIPLDPNLKSLSVPQPTEAAASLQQGAARIYAGPAVRRLARELGVDLSQVSGTGHNGRLVKDDVKAFVKDQLSRDVSATGGIPLVPVLDYEKYGPISTQPMGKIREVGAKNLHRSWLNVVHVTQHDEIDISDLEAFRASLKRQGEAKGIKITPLAFIIKACCAALAEFPTFNSSLDEQVRNFILKHYYHIGFAVDTPQGLLVPVIKNVDQKGIWELSAEIAELAEKARNRKLAVADMQGGTFSVSSLGAIGGTGFTPIVNAPEVAILGVGRLTTKPWWNGSEFVPAKMLPLSLSYDHRAINGAEAGRFVQRLGQLLGDVRQLLL